MVWMLCVGGSAEKNGELRAGDELLTVNGTDVTVLTRILAWGLMKRLPDGPVTLTVRHKLNKWQSTQASINKSWATNTKVQYQVPKQWWRGLPVNLMPYDVMELRGEHSCTKTDQGCWWTGGHGWRFKVYMKSGTEIGIKRGNSYRKNEKISAWKAHRNLTDAMWCHLYCVFTYIYSLLIEKDICNCQNVSLHFFQIF